MTTVINIGMLGLGTVGSGVWKILTERGDLLEERTGFRFQVKKVLVRDPQKKRAVELPAGRLTTRAEEVVNDPDISIVVEVMGGISPADRLIRSALENGKHVVTANKAILAEKGDEIFRWAREHRVWVGFEASVAGGIPILKAIREGFVGNRIEEIYGIINGTSNYILSEMTGQGREFREVLEEAKRLGFAEQDPRMDIDGRDAAQKLALLVAACTSCRAPLSEIFVEGIERITPFDIDSAKRLGFAIKLLAVFKQSQDGIEARVHPTLVPKSHPLADVSGAFNALFLKGDAVGEAMFYGRGAGMMPTASAVVSDLVDAAHLLRGGVTPLFSEGRKGIFKPMGDLMTEYYLRFSVVDRPGVLAEIAGHLGKSEISISSVFQSEQDQGARVPIGIVTHRAGEKSVRRAIESIDGLETVLDQTVVLRIERL